MSNLRRQIRPGWYKSVSPFSRHLMDLRKRFGLRQGELAELVGYDQSYLSALEIGQKGPPTLEFVERLGTVLSLTETEKQELTDAVDASDRKLTIANDSAEELFLLLKDLRDRLLSLSPIQVRMMRDLLRVHDPQPVLSALSEKKRIKQEARM
ncbi:MAG: helix-turn-helix transcriptional regulator [Pseudomonadota bacterium]